MSESEKANAEAPRQLSRQEAHDLSMIIKDRTKVLLAHADEQAASCLADFEKKMAAQYNWADDDVWKRATESSMEFVRKAQAEIDKRCAELGIPKTFAPYLGIGWQGRGENAVSQRRQELRLVAKAEIEAMRKAAITKIQKQGLDLRTQVVAMGLLSPDAKLFLDSLAPVEDAMRQLDFGEIERKLENESRHRLEDRRRLRGTEFG